MGLITTRGSVKFSEGLEDSASSNPPVINNFSVSINSDDINKFTLYFSVDNYETLILEKSFIGADGNIVPDSISNTNITRRTSVVDNKNKIYRTKFKLTAQNKNGLVSKEIEPIEVGTGQLNIFESSLFSNFEIERPSNAYDLVNIKVTLLKLDTFNINDLESLELRYKRQDFLSDLFINLDFKSPFSRVDNKNESGNIISYSFVFKNIQIKRPVIGGFFNFYTKIRVKNFETQNSETKALYFEDLSQSNNNLLPQGSFPNAVIKDKSTSLRYELLVKFSEVYVSQKDIETKSDGVTNPKYNAFSHAFLDTKNFAGLQVDNFLIPDSTGSGFLFYYEFNDKLISGETKGYFYPACVSEILPCIIVNKTEEVTDSLILFWKINNNFFSYSFFNNYVSITTLSLKVKLQYKNSSGNYEDLTSPFYIEELKHFDTSSQKFIVKIDKTQIKNITLFNSVNELDNTNDNLKIVILSHETLCSAKGYSTKQLTFDKLLIPHEWIYIAYDKYIPRNSIVRDANNKKITLNIDDPSLRGIRLPEKGFKIFETVQVKTLQKVSQTDFETTQTLKILYKLSSEVSSFYSDPIIEGTINSIVLPKIPDDVFLIAPTVNVPPPNLKTLENGGQQGGAVVNLDEYGKISNIQMVDLGEGYSQYKTYESKREQSSSDLTPIIKSSFKVSSVDLNITRSHLIPSNNSFDKLNLKASLIGGVRLASVAADKEVIDKSTTNPLSQTQKNELNEYFNNSFPEDAEVENNSVGPYVEKTTQLNYNSDHTLDQIWYDISKLYTEKYNNPLDEVNIYNEDDDPAASSLDPNTLSSESSYSEDSSSLTPTSEGSGSTQESASGGAWQLFSLNNLVVVPDSSPALSVSEKGTGGAPPWLTLMPLAKRSDGMWAFGPLPNVAPRAEMFNRIVMGINFLNEVRVIAPFVWTITNRTKTMTSYKESTEGVYTIINFDANGDYVETNDNISDYYVPVNSTLVVSSSRSVAKVQYKSRLLVLPAGLYNVSSQYETNIQFRPFIHPLLNNAIPPFLSKTLKRRFLGIVTEQLSSCSSVRVPKSPGTNDTVIYCSSPNWNNFGSVYEVPVPSSVLLPTTKNKFSKRFEFFDSGGSLSAPAFGTAKFFGIPYGTKSDFTTNFCSHSCEEGVIKTVDFTYTNMFPATCKLD